MMFFMIIYLKHTMEALQTLIITSTTYISNSATSIITNGISNKIHRLIDTQTIEKQNWTISYVK